jgi:hypothetical protein
MIENRPNLGDLLLVNACFFCFRLPNGRKTNWTNKILI